MASVLSPDLQALRVAKAFVDRHRAVYPIVEAWLYGSRARGDHRPDSDVDVAIVLDAEKEEARRIGRELAGNAFDELLETGLFISPFTIANALWTSPLSYSNPYLIQNIRREAIRL